MKKVYRELFASRKEAMAYMKKMYANYTCIKGVADNSREWDYTCHPDQWSGEVPCVVVLDGDYNVIAQLAWWK